MKIFLALIILLNSFGVIAAGTGQAQAQGRQMRSRPAPSCETPGQLMSSNILGKEFTSICNKLISQDEGCKKLKPEKRMNCSTKSANNVFSSNDIGPKIFQCAKGFLWDSMVDLAKFVLDLIKMLVGAQINSITSTIRFLSDSDFRARTLAAAERGAGAGFAMGKAFLNSAALYFAREFPRNAAKHPFNPLFAIGETLLGPLVNFITDSVQKIAAYYIPQYQCMNGTAKLYTFCRILGDFIMPPAFIFTFLKSGINGLRALKAGAEAAKIARVERRFAEANELREAASVARRVTPEAKPGRIIVDHTPGAPARRPPAHTPAPAAPRLASEVHPRKPAAPAPLAKPIEEHSADDLIELARSEQAESAAVADANRAEAARIEAQKTAPPEKLTPEEEAGRLAIDSQVEDLIEATPNSPELIMTLSKDPEYSSLFKAEKQYPEQNRDIAIVISDMQKKNPQMTKSQIREEIEKFINTCELKR